VLILERTVERKCTQGIDCKKTSLLYSAKMKKLEDKEVEKLRRRRKKRWTESHYSILRARMLKGEDKSERPMKKFMIKAEKKKENSENPLKRTNKKKNHQYSKIFKSWMCSRNQIFDFINNLESKFLLACVKKLQILD